MRLLTVLLACTALAAAEHGEILAALGPDRLAIQYYQLPVVIRLAEIEIPPATAEAAQARLFESVGKRSNITWAPELGADQAGMPRVYVTVGTESATLNEVLVEAGLARAKPMGEGGRNRERLATAEAKAKRVRAGIWAEAAAPAALVPPPVVLAAKGPFCAEVDGRNYYPSDAPEAARLNQKRLVFYASETAARKAGKQPWLTLAPGPAGTLESARAAYARGKALSEQAVGQAPTTERDQLYERAFLELSAATQVFSRLVEAKPEDTELGEELRLCMQLRYSAMKSKRFTK